MRRTVDAVHVGELLRDHGLDDDARLRALLEDLVGWAPLLAELRATGPGDWAAHGACRGQTSVMFPTRGESSEPGKALCASCPVHAECEEWAATVPAAQTGIIAGSAERARTQARRAAARLDRAA